MKNKFLDPIVFSGIPYADRPLQIPENVTLMEFIEDEDNETENGDEDDIPQVAPLSPMPQYIPVPVESTDSERRDNEQPHWPIPSILSPTRETQSPPKAITLETIKVPSTLPIPPPAPLRRSEHT
jgi:hypothetical protein